MRARSIATVSLWPDHWGSTYRIVLLYDRLRFEWDDRRNQSTYENAAENTCRSSKRSDKSVNALHSIIQTWVSRKDVKQVVSCRRWPKFWLAHYPEFHQYHGEQYWFNCNSHNPSNSGYRLGIGCAWCIQVLRCIEGTEKRELKVKANSSGAGVQDVGGYWWY